VDLTTNPLKIFIKVLFFVTLYKASGNIVVFFKLSYHSIYWKITYNREIVLVFDFLIFLIVSNYILTTDDLCNNYFDCLSIIMLIKKLKSLLISYLGKGIGISFNINI